MDHYCISLPKSPSPENDPKAVPASALPLPLNIPKAAPPPLPSNTPKAGTLQPQQLRMPSRLSKQTKASPPEATRLLETIREDSTVSLPTQPPSKAASSLVQSTQPKVSPPYTLPPLDVVELVSRVYDIVAPPTTHTNADGVQQSRSSSSEPENTQRFFSTAESSENPSSHGVVFDQTAYFD